MGTLLGNNGQNWFEAQTDQDVISIKQMLQPGQSFCLRLRDDPVDRPVYVPKFDEHGIELPPSGSNVDNIVECIKLHNELLADGKYLKVIYCAPLNYVLFPIADTIARIQKLITAGVDVIDIEAGNEYYSREQADFSFSKYKTAFEPLMLAVKATFTIPFTIFLAPRPTESGVPGGLGNHSRFNNDVINYVKLQTSEVGVSIHIYFSEKDCAAMNTLPAERIYNNNLIYPDLSDFYSLLFSQTSTASLWDKTLSYIESKLPGRKIFITEFGYTSSQFKNTVGYSMMAWQVWQRYGQRESIAALCEHNGLSLSSPGMIFPANNKDLNPSGFKNLPRVGYFCQQLFRESGILLEHAQITQAGTIKRWFVNAGSALSVALPVGLSAGGVKIRYIGGNKLYSSSGSVEWMDKGSIASYEIDGIKTGSILQFPDNSFGYYEATISGTTQIPDPPDPTPSPKPPKQSFWCRWFNIGCK